MPYFTLEKSMFDSRCCFILPLGEEKSKQTVNVLFGSRGRQGHLFLVSLSIAKKHTGKDVNVKIRFSFVNNNLTVHRN